MRARHAALLLALASPALASLAGAQAAGAQAAGAQAADDPSDPRAALEEGLRADVASDWDGAFAAYLRAARLGLAQAQFNAAVMLDLGRGMPRDARRAAMWYAAAAAQGHGRAAYDLAQLYAQGDGVPRNAEMAAAWRREAALHGVKAARGGAAEERPPSGAQDAALATAEPLMPAPDAAVARPAGPDGSRAVQLVWSAPPQARPVRWFVEVMATGGPRPNEVFAGYAPASALSVTLDGAPASYAWRVTAAGTDGGHYRAGAWQMFSLAAPEREAD